MERQLHRPQTSTHYNTAANSPERPPCTDPTCFFCAMNEPNPSLRRPRIAKCFKEMPHKTKPEHVLVLSGLWNMAMAQPDDPEFPSLGVLECMSKLIHRGLNDPQWLLRDQNIYIPYYAAHVIGSYAMNKPQFAERAVKGGVLKPLMELLRGKISWVEQRVAVRALGHLASHDRALQAFAVHETEITELAMKIASSCLSEVYDKFLSVKEVKRLKYQCDLLTRGLGGSEIENRKAEEWASQIQCWSLYLLNCFASRERSLKLICNTEFLTSLCKMWGGLANRTSPAGIGLLRTLCFTKFGRKHVSDSKQVVEFLCNVSRSSDDWQFMGVECLAQLLKDTETRYEVLDVAAPYLADLVELENRARVGEAITQALLQDYHKFRYGNLRLKSKRAERALEETWDLKVERKKRETLMAEQELNQSRRSVGVLKKMGNQKFWSGDIEKAVDKYSEALGLCPLSLRKERIVLHSNRAQCYLLLGDPEAAISDSTRALCLSSSTGGLHGKSLWRRSQAYDMKGLAKESLMDCLMFLNSRVRSDREIPYYAVGLIRKQMDATWIFGDAKSKKASRNGEKGDELNVDDHILKKMITEVKGKKKMEMSYTSTMFRASTTLDGELTVSNRRRRVGGE